MISFETRRQAEEAVKLWREAFHDDEAYIRFFLSHHEGAAVLTESINGSLVSALYLLEGAVVVDSVPCQARYLFAAATFRAHRGRGHMARLLQKAQDCCAGNGDSYIALVPASPALFDYYARFGYRTAFYAAPAAAESDFTFDQTTDRFLWSDAHLRYIREEAKAFGFPLLEKNGVLFSVDENTVKLPDPTKRYPCGMLLPLNETAKRIMPDNAYIGLTME